MKTKINLIIDISAFVCFLVSGFAGIILWQILPSGNGFRGGRSDSVEDLFWGLYRHQWNDVHIYSGLILVALVLLHLILHWNWIKNIPKLFKTK
ncbi:MAG: DUF4405 domain-containing protein [Candidatus Portnoybacteria bacterium]|nr:DUF4405 domain-containing protein [Candidatus Portnoybacteria bacterium]